MVGIRYSTMRHIYGIVKRIVFVTTAVWLALSLAFVLMRVLPGDAIEAQLTAAGFESSAITERREVLGLNDPLPLQYARYILSLMRGDLGSSLYSGEPVGVVIMSRGQGTVTLASAALAWLGVMSIALGLTAAQSGFVGEIGRAIIAVSVSVPSYVTGTAAILLFGLSDPNSLFGVGLAAFVLGLHTSGPVANVLRISLGETWQALYISAARARGLRRVRIATRHVLPHAIISVLPLLAGQAGFLFGGTVMTEMVFARPGLGRLMLDSVLRRDLPVVQGLILLSALIFAAFQLLSDLAAFLLDPRSRV